MIDLKILRNDPELVRESLRRRRSSVDLDAFIVLDARFREERTRIDTLKNEQSKTTDRDRAKALKDEIRALEEAYKTLEAEHEAVWKSIPNLLHPDAPDGDDDESNQVLRMVGTPREFTFIPRDHETIGVARGWIDKETAAKVSGARFTYLFGDLVLLQYALATFVTATLTSREMLARIIANNGLVVSDKPFIPTIPPVIVNQSTMEKMGRLHPMDERYILHDQGQVLIGSAEHSLGPIPMDKILEEDELPLRYFANTPAFRGEAGSAGRDVSGILRVHQFDKIEMESFVAPEDGLAEQDLFVALQEYFVSSLGLPYRVVFNSSGDTGSMDYRQRDVETWMPGQDKYRETHTSDYMTDYQARRLGIRVKRASGEKQYVHMNDATAMAMGRLLIAIIENYQNEDMTVTIPEVLRPFMGGRERI
ncbi:MAG TPA: serine--tRNA ligase [bacterium]|nr:serine--tRNA ligase [bacterium]